MNTKPVIFLALIVVLTLNTSGQDNRPTIGVALSGGGAKGLAHIGILKAIDSAGLKIDYLTGTSMGSIIGALYAVGYSAADIEKMARKVDWDAMLTNQSSLRGLVMQEKDEYSRYAIELPWENNGFRLPSGVLEGEELWLKFAELFFPVYNIKDFSRFSIPFKCISADIATGEAVVLDTGEIVTAIRSSMAIPSLFTAIEQNGKRLVDGGVVRNFPVRDVKEMGADLVIGSRVAMGLKPKEKVNNAFQILMQIVFFKEAASSKEEIELCNIYVPMPLDDYTAASFNRSGEILEHGLEQGRKLYPALKKLADSLDDIYGKRTLPSKRLPTIDSVYITDVEINGLKHTTRDFFNHMMGFETGRFYTSARLGRMTRKVFGTRYYSRIVYRFVPGENGAAKIVFDVEENPVSFAKLGVHYNNFTGISMITNLTSRNLFLPHSRSLLTLNIGENMRARAEHLQYLGRGKNVALVLGGQYDNMQITTYDDFKRDGLYRMQVFRADGRMEYSANRKFTVGAGTRFEWIKYKPGLQSVFDLEGKNEFVTSYSFFAVNTLNKRIYPARGIKVEGEAGIVYNQSPDITFYQDGTPVDHPDSLGISYKDYQKASISFEGYVPLSDRLTFTSEFQSAVNFNYTQSILNDYSIGGLVKTFRNQIPVAGLEENSFNTPSVAVARLGFRYEIYNNVFIMGRADGLINNFISTNNILQKPAFVSGYALTFGYNFALGPLEISAMYSDKPGKLHGYINLGIPF